MANIQSILRDLQEVEDEIEDYHGVEQLDYAYDEDMANEVRVVYSGTDLPPQIARLLSRSDSTISSIYTDAPVTLKLVISPTPYYE